jgi:hypothetical protein
MTRACTSASAVIAVTSLAVPMRTDAEVLCGP